MQWNTEIHAGFSTAEPWLKVNDNYSQINAENQMQDENSIFNYYRKLIQFLKESDIIAYGSYVEYCADHPSIYVYERAYKNEKIFVLCNFSANEITYDPSLFPKEKHTILANYKDQKGGILRAYEAIVWKA
ncbi:MULTISPECIES: alpha-glucosidase C-terminal domain-containing protein [Breznakia]|uniref:Maltogenic amylase-like enzyme n=1 Tax=Breznakia blatticola TaxID=1754012 RepID=A0A4R8A6W9_9FIRM|nr:MULTISPECIES: alpha-glucosidase C-terminal domain-containing protein [Breznakia]MDH6367329.1 glycosidase [Breznakia sp. PH1-1]MDH6404523.1 glycosidase [Breznakia sp. PF1-11]MDH6412232.1 glycosidase [Breznakia sp. PFB1-11]MDH6414496.1 glycosidase [Breznakia sp. PFB1-14]MDH6416896.1 glycosidase [Breznakia sp. PFB1-4]